MIFAKPISSSAGSGEELRILTNPDGMPPEWDGRFGGKSAYNHKIFLQHLFRTNPVAQKYFYCRRSGEISLAGSMYRTKLPFCLGAVCLGVPVSVCGIPMIYGSQAGFTPISAIGEAAVAMDDAWPGFQWIVGLGGRGEEISGWSWKRQLLTVDLPIRWNSYGKYLDDFRSGYRYKINKVLENGAELDFGIFQSPGFTERAYRQYRELAAKPDFRQDILARGFFSDFPLDHVFLSCQYQGELAGWALLVPQQDELSFLFCGLDQGLNLKLSVYKNLLLKMTEYAIANGYTVLHLGQTAELAKMLVGGMPSERYILTRHTNPLINQIVKRTDVFNFRKYYPPLRVFKS